ncbi:MAG: hypoxanthine phosphoribosyltransferase [Clostridia bacterium]|nr:hypoxanthine phosphoribosyltransferase [Clostridia bacterium]
MIQKDVSALYGDLSGILLSRDVIANRVAELGKTITHDFSGHELVCICILKGAATFFVDLIRNIDLPLHVDYMAISSYERGTQSTGRVRFVKDLDHDVGGRDVLLIEDIIDSGLTLSFLRDHFATLQSRSLSICTLLDKPARRKIQLTPDYVGFTIDDHFVVGYGLDYAETYRNLPDIGVLRPDIYRN